MRQQRGVNYKLVVVISYQNQHRDDSTHVVAWEWGKLNYKTCLALEGLLVGITEARIHSFIPGFSCDFHAKRRRRARARQRHHLWKKTPYHPRINKSTPFVPENHARYNFPYLHYSTVNAFVALETSCCVVFENTADANFLSAFGDIQKRSNGYTLGSVGRRRIQYCFGSLFQLRLP